VQTHGELARAEAERKTPFADEIAEGLWFGHRIQK
jgi:hypothetical protein